MIWSSDVIETPLPTGVMAIAVGVGVGAVVTVEVAVGLGPGVGNDVGVGLGVGVAVAGTVGVVAGGGEAVVAGVGAVVGAGVGVAVVAGSGVGKTVGVGVEAGVFVGPSVAVGAGVVVGAGSGVFVGPSVAVGVGVVVGAGSGGFVWVRVGEAVGALVGWARGVIVDAAAVSTKRVGSIVSSLPQPTDTIINSKMRRQDSRICCFSCHKAVVEMRCISLLPLLMPFQTADLLGYHTSVYSNCLLMREMTDWQFRRAPGCGRYEPLRGYCGGKYNAWYCLPSTMVGDGGPCVTILQTFEWVVAF